MKKLMCCAALLGAVPVLAHAEVNPAEEVYGATVEKGEVELEARYGRLDGGPDADADVLKLEAAYGVTDRLRVAVVGELGKEPGESRRFNAAAIEGIYSLGRAGGIDFAVYGEFEMAFDGPNELETKLLMQRRTGPWDLRLNLIASKELSAEEPVEFGYAASADIALTDRFRLGAQAFGDLGSVDHFAPSAQHFIGPAAKARLIKSDPDGDGDDHGGLTLTAGYLFALGETRDDTSGQFRLQLEAEF